jgi:hypothetical protein
MVLDWIEELNERSKRDDAIIVGSEVRMLVNEINRLTVEAGVLKEELDKMKNTHRGV